MSTLSLNKKGSTQECGTVSGGSNPPLAAKTTTNNHLFIKTMTKTKKLTLTIARILAERVREKLSTTAKTNGEKHKEKVLASKEYADFEKLRVQENEIRNKLKKLEEKIVDKYSTPMMKITVQGVYCNRPASISIYENQDVTVDSIRDMIILEDHFAESTITHEEIVDKIVAKFLKP